MGTRISKSVFDLMNKRATELSVPETIILELKLDAVSLSPTMIAYDIVILFSVYLIQWTVYEM